MKVLVVEDEPGRAAELRDLLDAAAPGEFELVAVASPAAAVGRLLGVGRPDLEAVLLVLPAGTTLQPVEQLRTAGLGAALVVLTGDDDDAFALDAVAVGGQEALPRRAIDGRQLARALRHAATRQRRENVLAHRALHDPLTGLPNRSLFLDRLRQALSRVARSGSCLAVLFLDLDDFKAVNDRHGHAAGDELLADVGGRLEAVLRGGDTAARIGGDEFVVLCEEVAGEEEVRGIAERLLAEVPARASIGIALTADGRADPDGLVRDADAAMYRVKRSGGGAYAFA